MIQAQSVCTRYHRKGDEVLHGVSFTLEQSQIGVLMGPNGAGKSTLIRCLLGSLPYQGKILLDGKDLASLKSKERASLVAYVPQRLMFSSSNVFESVMIGRVPSFMFAPSKEDEDIVWDCLGELGIKDLAHRNVNELSGGEQQKVAIARALAQRSKILILDEPTSNLDIAAEQNVVHLVKNLAKKLGFTVLLSAHDLNIALSSGDRFIFISEGKVAYEGGEEIMNEKSIKDVFGIDSKRIEVDGQSYILYGGSL